MKSVIAGKVNIGSALIFSVNNGETSFEDQTFFFTIFENKCPWYSEQAFLPKWNKLSDGIGHWGLQQIIKMGFGNQFFVSNPPIGLAE